MNDHKLKYSKESPLTKDLHELVKRVKPTILIGASAQTNAFNAQILQNMLEFSSRPVIFALSNPTIKAECTAEDAYTHTKVKLQLSLPPSLSQIISSVDRENSLQNISPN